MQQAKHIASITFQSLAFLMMLDLLILFASIGQIALEGRTGHWNPFWRTQAEMVVRLLPQNEKKPVFAELASSEPILSDQQANHITQR
ncbi:hypothetical protein EPO34_03490 [Patescibacteria group bacterium]|nr:MAG: hypothetical protein EPO34_03490 [Patescibacteria group bacterium]